jgi:hypothetical protein
MDIVHDAIPHHHFGQNAVEVSIHHDQNGIHNLGNTEDHQHSFPLHQHFYCAEDLSLSRVGNHVQIEIRKISSELVLLLASENKEWHKPPGLKNQPEYSVSLQNYPFICSPNAMRGSPFIS